MTLDATEMLIQLLARALEGFIYGSACYVGLLLIGRATPKRKAESRGLSEYATGGVLLFVLSAGFWFYPWHIGPDLINMRYPELSPSYSAFGVILALGSALLGYLGGGRIYEVGIRRRLPAAAQPRQRHAAVVPATLAAPTPPVPVGASPTAYIEGVEWSQSPEEHYRSLVANATLMLDYAIEQGLLRHDGQKLDELMIQGVQRAQEAFRQKNLDENIRKDLQTVYRDLAILLRPVTVESLKATSENYPSRSVFARRRPIAIAWSRKLSGWTIAFVLIAVIGSIYTAANGPLPDPGELGKRYWTELGLMIFKYTVPFTYGAIGACIALLKVCQALIYLRQFDPRRIPEYYNRMILGAVSGGMIVILADQFTSSGSNSDSQVSEAALGLLAGYNSDLLFSAIERISTAILPRVGAESVQQNAAPAPFPSPAIKPTTRRRIAPGNPMKPGQ